jgi:hypothetical protein
MNNMTDKIPEYLIWKIVRYKLQPHPTAQIIRKYNLKNYAINILRKVIIEFNFIFRKEDIEYLDSLWSDIYFEFEDQTLYYYDCRTESEYD